MDEETITFDTIREAYRNERNSPILQPVETDFYQKILEYIARKKGELESARNRGGRFGNKMVKIIYIITIFKRMSGIILQIWRVIT